MSPSRPKAPSSKRKGAAQSKAPRQGKHDEKAATVERIEINYEQLKSVTKLIQLNAINLIDGGMRSEVDPRAAESLGGEKSYTLLLGDARWWIDGTSVDVLLGYRVTGTASIDGKKVDLFTITARFLASYVLPEGATIPSENRDNLLADLVAANGQINVFPYLRQFVNDLTARAGWPPLVLRVLKAPAHRPQGLVRMGRAWEPLAEKKALDTAVDATAKGQS